MANTDGATIYAAPLPLHTGRLRCQAGSGCWNPARLPDGSPRATLPFCAPCCCAGTRSARCRCRTSELPWTDNNHQTCADFYPHLPRLPRAGFSIACTLRAPFRATGLKDSARQKHRLLAIKFPWLILDAYDACTCTALVHYLPTVRLPRWQLNATGVPFTCRFYAGG